MRGKAEPRRNRMSSILLIFLMLAGGAYLLVAALVYFGQTALLFPTGAVRPAANPLPRNVERLALRTSDGALLHGVHLRGDHVGPRQSPVILGFGGNAWNAEAAAIYLHGLYPGSDVVIFHFRGYRPSTGQPSAAALLDDASTIHAFVADRFSSRPIVAIGFSIGSAAAARIARDRPLAGLILVTPFDSLATVGSSHCPWLPVRALLRHPMEPARDLRGSAVPVAIIAGERDTLIPPASTAALRRAVGNLVFDRTIEGCDHNDIYGEPAFRNAMTEALAAIVGEGRPAT